MLQELYKKKIPTKSVTFDPSYMQLNAVDSVEDGVIVRTSAFKSRSVADDYKHIKYTDFSISNLLAVGAYKETNVMMNANSQLSNADAFGAANERIDAMLSQNQ